MVLQNRFFSDSVFDGRAFGASSDLATPLIQLDEENNPDSSHRCGQLFSDTSDNQISSIH